AVVRDRPGWLASWLSPLCALAWGVLPRGITRTARGGSRMNRDLGAPTRPRSTRQRRRSTATVLATALIALLAGATARAQPANDACIAAVVIDPAATSFHDTQQTATATIGAEDFSTCSCVPDGATGWYRLTPAASRLLTVDTIGSSYDTVLDVFRGDCTTKTDIACNDQAVGSSQSRVSFAACAGRTYLIEASAFCGTPGGTLNLSLS